MSALAIAIKALEEIVSLEWEPSLEHQRIAVEALIEITEARAEHWHESNNEACRRDKP